MGPLRVAHRFAFPVKQSVSAAEPSTIANGFQETRCETSTQIKTQQEQLALNNGGGIFLGLYDSWRSVGIKESETSDTKEQLPGERKSHNRIFPGYVSVEIRYFEKKFHVWLCRKKMEKYLFFFSEQLFQFRVYGIYFSHPTILSFECMSMLLPNLFENRAITGGGGRKMIGLGWLPVGLWFLFRKVFSV